MFNTRENIDAHTAAATISRTSVARARPVRLIIAGGASVIVYGWTLKDSSHRSRIKKRKEGGHN